MIKRYLEGKPYQMQAWRGFDPLQAYKDRQKLSDQSWLKAQIRQIRATSNTDFET